MESAYSADGNIKKGEFMNAIDRRFLKFNDDNPHIMDAIVRYTLQLKTAGRTQFGIAAVFERTRWDYAISTKPDQKGFKLSNDYRSRYVRLLEIERPEFKGFYRTRGIDPTSMFAPISAGE